MTGSDVVFAGENPLIMLYRPGGDDLVAVASLWSARWTPHGAGTSLLVWVAEGPGTPAFAAICTDRPELARWLWDTFNRRWEPLLGRGLEEAPPRPATFTETRTQDEHRVTCRADGLEIELVWREPTPVVWTETQPYEYDTTAVIVPCLDADIVVDGVPAPGEVRPHDDVFVSSAALAFCETWVLRS